MTNTNKLQHCQYSNHFSHRQMLLQYPAFHHMPQYSFYSTAACSITPSSLLQHSQTFKTVVTFPNTQLPTITCPILLIQAPSPKLKHSLALQPLSTLPPIPSNHLFSIACPCAPPYSTAVRFCIANILRTTWALPRISYSLLSAAACSKTPSSKLKHFLSGILSPIYAHPHSHAFTCLPLHVPINFS